MTDPDMDLVLAAVRGLTGQGNAVTPESILRWISRGATVDSIAAHLAELELQGAVERRADGPAARWVERKP